jgi:hypothetical protein
MSVDLPENQDQQVLVPDLQSTLTFHEKPLIAVRLASQEPAPYKGAGLLARGSLTLDQSQPLASFFGRDERGSVREETRYVQVLHQPGPLRCRIKQADGVKPVFCTRNLP